MGPLVGGRRRMPREAQGARERSRAALRQQAPLQSSQWSWEVVHGGIGRLRGLLASKEEQKLGRCQKLG